MFEKLISFITTAVTNGYNNYTDTIIVWFFGTTVFYFLYLRVLIPKFAIRAPKMTKKERKARQKADKEQPGGDTIDVIFSGINKISLWRLKRWLLCNCYRDEDKTRWFGIYKALNCIYLAYVCVVDIILLLGIWCIPFRWGFVGGVWLFSLLIVGSIIPLGIWFWTRKGTVFK